MLHDLAFFKQVKTGHWRRPSWIWRSKHADIIEMMSDMYSSPRETPEMIYWKTGLAKSVKNGIHDGLQRPFWILAPTELAHTFVRGTLANFFI